MDLDVDFNFDLDFFFLDDDTFGNGSLSLWMVCPTMAVMTSSDVDSIFVYAAAFGVESSSSLEATAAAVTCVVRSGCGLDTLDATFTLGLAERGGFKAQEEIEGEGAVGVAAMVESSSFIGAYALLDMVGLPVPVAKECRHLGRAFTMTIVSPSTVIEVCGNGCFSCVKKTVYLSSISLL